MGGRDFFGRLAARRDVTAFAIRDALVRHVPSYGVQSTAQHAILLREVHETWSPILRRAPLEEPLSVEDLAVYRTLARTRAAHAFPFAEFRTGFEVAHTAGLRECLALAEPGDAVHPVAFTTWGVRELPRVLDVVTGSYLKVCEQRGRRAAAREILLEALLEGRLPTSVRPAPAGHLVLLLRPGHRGTVPSGRPEAVDRVLRETEGTVWRGGPVEGELLVLMDVTKDVESARATAAELTATLAGAWHGPLHAAEAHASIAAGVPAALHDVRRTLALVAAMPDARNRPYRAEELLVELAVARDPDVRLRLAGLLDPLRDGTDLRRTLEVLFDCDMDRRRTAEALHLHRRSLTYRLQRIRRLSGFDPATAHGIQVLRSALIAARLTGGR